jgi:hypothetical protein
MLGHSGMALTADTYTSVYPTVAAEAAAAAAALVPRRAVAGIAAITPLSHKGSGAQRAGRKPR